MPTYDSRVKCPDCGGRAKKLLGTGANIIFKGSGFYETDYRRKRTASSEPAAKAETSNGTASTKSESKDSTGSGKPEQ